MTHRDASNYYEVESGGGAGSRALLQILQAPGERSELAKRIKGNSNLNEKALLLQNHKLRTTEFDSRALRQRHSLFGIWEAASVLSFRFLSAAPSLCQPLAEIRIFRD